jgi:exosortase D (VPLPA-CTERM-specific)
VLAWIGWRGVREIWAPLLYLVFIVPLPSFLYQGLSSELQLISSELGVWFVRLFGVSVFLEGNVIDLGIYKLQVVEACSGLRYLFPLTSFAFLCAYLYRGSWWQKGLIFVSAAPVTILLNSLRIGVIGVLVEHWGIEMAEGFLHFFEGWIIFLAGVGLLFGLMWILARLSGRRGGLQDLVRLEMLWPAGSGEGAAAGSGQGVSGQAVSRSVAAAVGFLAVGAVAMGALPARSEVVPEWKSFATFPMRLGEWQGRDQPLEQQYLDVLKLDDYVLADYRRPGGGAAVNFYLAYYGSQRKGASVHSPRSCIPGGGWEIGAFVPVAVDGVTVGGRPLEVNRVVIAKGSSRQLVYYWFDQRGRQMTNEYGVKWMIFWDALTRNRTDGALVRLVTPVGPGEDLGRAERRLGEFLKEAYPEISAYVPG